MNAQRKGRYRPPIKYTHQYATLAVLEGGQPLTLRAIVAKLYYNPKTVYNHLRSLRSQGYVEISGPRRKGATYCLTERGRQALES